MNNYFSYAMPDGTFLPPTPYNRKNWKRIWKEKKVEMKRNALHVASSNFKLAELEKCSRTKEKEVQKNRNNLHSKYSSSEFKKQFFDGLRKLKTGEIKQLILTPIR